MSHKTLNNENCSFVDEFNVATVQPMNRDPRRATIQLSEYSHGKSLAVLTPSDLTNGSTRVSYLSLDKTPVRVGRRLSIPAPHVSHSQFQATRLKCTYSVPQKLLLFRFSMSTDDQGVMRHVHTVNKHTLMHTHHRKGCEVQQQVV